MLIKNIFNFLEEIYVVANNHYYPKYIKFICKYSYRK